jgi:hypothetical protein
MLHRYFQAHPNGKPKYDLYIIIIGCLLVSFKSHEDQKQIDQLFSALLVACREFASRIGADRLSRTLSISDFSDRPITRDELLAVNSCEIDVLAAHGYASKLDISFNYTEKFVDPVIRKMPETQFRGLRDAICRNQCFALILPRYLELKPEIIAVAATLKAFNGLEIPEEIGEWIATATEKYGRDAVGSFQALLVEQQARVEQVAPPKPAGAAPAQ